MYKLLLLEQQIYLVIKMAVNVMLQFRFHVILVRVEHVLSTSYNKS